MGGIVAAVMGGPEKKKRGRPRQTAEVALSDARSLDRRSPVPLYFQLAEVLAEILETGTWQPGARFASEREIEEQFRVSRTVIRPALELLVGDGLIVRVRGQGAFIAPPKREILVTGLVKALLERPDDLAIKILAADRREPDRTVTRLLQLDSNPSPVADVTALINPGERSAFLLYSFSSMSRVPWLLPVATALKEGRSPPNPGPLELGRSTISIEGTFFSRWSATKLGVSPGDPALTGRLVQFRGREGAELDSPLEFARVIYRVDGAQLTIDVD
jgi:GntR family transcriptional regulator